MRGGTQVGTFFFCPNNYEDYFIYLLNGQLLSTQLPTSHSLKETQPGGMYPCSKLMSVQCKRRGKAVWMDYTGNSLLIQSKHFKPQWNPKENYLKTKMV